MVWVYKKLLSIILAVVVTFTFSAAAYAAEPMMVVEGHIEYINDPNFLFHYLSVYDDSDIDIEPDFAIGTPPIMWRFAEMKRENNVSFYEVYPKDFPELRLTAGTDKKVSLAKADGSNSQLWEICFGHSPITTKIYSHNGGGYLGANFVDNFDFNLTDRQLWFIPNQKVILPAEAPIPAPAPGMAISIEMNVGLHRYTVNNQAAFFDTAPYVEPVSGRTMVPIRFIAEAFGAKVFWDDSIKTGFITFGDKTLAIELGKELPGNMGKAAIVFDRLFVPVRYVSEQLGAAVKWTAHNEPIIIKKHAE